MMKPAHMLRLSARAGRCRFLICGFAVLLGAAGAAPAAFAGKPDAECRRFAAESQFQLKDSQTFSCGFPDGWNGNWQQNYDYCRRAEPESTDRIARNRSVMMHMCIHVCRDYANSAVSDIKTATEGNCLHPNVPGWMPGLSGPFARWSGGYDAHFAWCMSGVSLEVINKERQIRATEAPRCRICDEYAFKTEKQANEQKMRQCGYDGMHHGDQWSTDRWLHFRHCMGNPLDKVKAWANRQTVDRVNLLNKCPSPQTKEMCERVARRAVHQREAIDKKKTVGFCGLQGLENSRWNKDFRVHYEGCLVNPSTAAGEENARDAHLAECGITGEADVPPAAPVPPPPNCTASVELTNKVCLDSYSEPSEWIDPGSYRSGCFLGETKQQAIENAIEAVFKRNKLLFTDDPQNPQECSYEVEEFIGCTCERGFGTRSYPGPGPSIEPPKERPGSNLDVLERTPPASVEGGADVIAKPPMQKCFADMVLNADGRCACREGDVWRGKSCEAATAACPPGTSGTFPNCSTPSSSAGADTSKAPCPPGTTGTYPNCITPAPSGGADAGAQPSSSSGSNGSKDSPGTSSSGTQGARCPLGTEWKRGKCRVTGGYQQRPKCPPGTFGSPPACCPAGTTYANGVCLRGKPREQKVQRCPRGTAGIYPNCFMLEKKLPGRPQPQADSPFKPAPKGDLQMPEKSSPGGGAFKPKPRGTMRLPPCRPGEARVGNGPCGPK
jgi:hypothetical protein